MENNCRNQTIKWLLFIMAILLIGLAIPTIIWSVKEGGVIPIFEIIGSVLGLILGVMIIVGIFIPSPKLLTICFYSAIVLLGFKIVTFLLTLLRYVLASDKQKEELKMTLGTVIVAAIVICIHVILPFMIKWHAATLNHELPGFWETITFRRFRQKKVPAPEDPAAEASEGTIKKAPGQVAIKSGVREPQAEVVKA